MALAIQSYHEILLDSADTLWTGDPSLTLYTDGQFSGTACNGLKAETTVVRVFSPAFAQSYDMSQTANSGTNVFVWMRIQNYYDLDYSYNGGIQICFEDVNGAQACYYVGGPPGQTNDTWSFLGGWMRVGYQISHTRAPNWTNGLTLDKTQIVKIGAAFLFRATTSLTHNVFIDKCEMASPIYSPNGYGGVVVTGLNTTDGNAWEELYDLSEQGSYGILTRRAGSIYEMNMPIQIGSDVDGDPETRFVDAGNSVFTVALFRVAPSYPFLSVTANATNPTYVRIGDNPVIDGVTRGVNGILLGGSASADFAWRVDRYAPGTVSGGMYGIMGPRHLGWGGADYRWGNMEYVDCQFSSTGSLAFSTNRVEHCTFFGGTQPDYGIVTIRDNTWLTNFKNNLFINNDGGLQISGGTSPFVIDGLKFYGNTFDIVNRTGLDIVIQCINGSNPDPLKINNVLGGSVTLEFPNTLIINIKDTNGNPLSGIEVSIVRSSDRTVLFNVENTDATGSVTYSYSTIETVDILFNAPGYKPIISDKYDYTLPSQDTTLEITLFDDENYNNPV